MYHDRPTECRIISCFYSDSICEIDWREKEHESYRLSTLDGEEIRESFYYEKVKTKDYPYSVFYDTKDELIDSL